MYFGGNNDLKGVGPKSAALLKKTMTLQAKLNDTERELQQVTLDKEALQQSFRSESQV